MTPAAIAKAVAAILALLLLGYTVYSARAFFKDYGDTKFKEGMTTTVNTQLTATVQSLENQATQNKELYDKATKELEVARQNERRLRRTFDSHSLSTLLGRRPTQVITKINGATNDVFAKVAQTVEAANVPTPVAPPAPDRMRNN